MITLYTFGPYFGLPDGSPFVIKVMLLLKFAGLEYREDRGGYGQAPKGKLPYINDDGLIVADSTFVRFHIEKKYGFDFDAGLAPEQRAVAWAAEKMCEEHLYFALLATRWCNDANFAKGPAQFFKAVPMPFRPIVQRLVRRKVTKTLKLQGFGRHSQGEQAELATADINALAALIGDKAFLMGEKPCGADATVFASVACFLTPVFDTQIRTAAEHHPNLAGYKDRITRLYFSHSEPNRFPRQAPPNRLGQSFRFQPTRKSFKSPIDRKGLPSPARAGFQGRQLCRSPQFLGVTRLSFPYIVVNKQGFTAGQRFGRDSFVSRSNRTQWACGSLIVIQKSAVVIQKAPRREVSAKGFLPA
jgi:glutathione S-transferase